jgi:hypothetical protein
MRDEYDRITKYSVLYIIFMFRWNSSVVFTLYKFLIYVHIHINYEKIYGHRIFMWSFALIEQIEILGFATIILHKYLSHF